jgi:Lrp/AsnC family transcriptional regulator
MAIRKSKESPNARLDRIDRRILAILQEDAATPLQEIAAKVSLSTTPCWRRIQQLKDRGVIRRTVAILDPAKVDLPVSVFVAIKTSQHNAAWLERFARGVTELAEVVEFYRMSGDVDYLLRVVVPDIAGYDVFYKKLIKVAELTDVSSSFAMEEIKYTTALPLGQG